jgi:hypothetical protein
MRYRTGGCGKRGWLSVSGGRVRSATRWRRQSMRELSLNDIAARWRMAAYDRRRRRRRAWRISATSRCIAFTAIAQHSAAPGRALASAYLARWRCRSRIALASARNRQTTRATSRAGNRRPYHLCAGAFSVRGAVLWRALGDIGEK